jgi:hypothetical protein
VARLKPCPSRTSFPQPGRESGAHFIQCPGVRFAPVERTKLLSSRLQPCGGDKPVDPATLSSRPEESWALGPPKRMKNMRTRPFAQQNPKHEAATRSSLPERFFERAYTDFLLRAASDDQECFSESRMDFISAIALHRKSGGTCCFCCGHEAFLVLRLFRGL